MKQPWQEMHELINCSSSSLLYSRAAIILQTGFADYFIIIITISISVVNITMIPVATSTATIITTITTNIIIMIVSNGLDIY